MTAPPPQAPEPPPRQGTLSKAAVRAQEALVARALDGDAQAFTDLIRPELQPLHQAAYYLARDADDAQDLAQLACIRAFQGLKQFRADAPLRPWLHRILRNLFLDRMKSAAVRHEVRESDDAPALQGPVTDSNALHDMLKAEDTGALTAHIRALPANFQEVLVLCDVQELSYIEVSEITGVAVGTVKSRLSRARLMLRDRVLASGELSRDANRIKNRGG